MTSQGYLLTRQGSFIATAISWHSFWRCEKSASITTETNSIPHHILKQISLHQFACHQLSQKVTIAKITSESQPLSSIHLCLLFKAKSHKSHLCETLLIANTTWVCVPRWSGAAGQCCGSWAACGTAAESDEGSSEESHRGTSWGIHRASQTATVVSAWWAECYWVGRNMPPQSSPTGLHSCCCARVWENFPLMLMYCAALLLLT